VTAAIGVLEKLDDVAVRDAVQLFRQLREGQPPDPKLIRTVGAALLVRNMSPKLRDEEMDIVERKSFLEAAARVFRGGASLPSKQHIARVHREFEAAFSRRPLPSDPKPPATEEP
jgi:hypothetical protein